MSQLTGDYIVDLMERGDLSTANTVARLHRTVAGEMKEPLHLVAGHAIQASLAIYQGRFSEATRWVEQCLDRARGFSHAREIHNLLRFSLLREQGQLEELRQRFHDPSDAQLAGDVRDPALALLYTDLGMLDEARTLFETLALNDFSGIRRGPHWSLDMAYLAEACVILGDSRRAGILYQCLLPYRDRLMVAVNGCHGPGARLLGMLAGLEQRWEIAQQHFLDAMALAETTGGLPAAARTAYHHATLLLARNHRDDPRRAAELLNRARESARELGMTGLSRACASLAQQSPPVTEHPAGLSCREMEVLCLLADGKSNRAIADTLSISQHTVANHIRSILNKTTSANRTEAALYATRHGLVTPAGSQD